MEYETISSSARPARRQRRAHGNTTIVIAVVTAVILGAGGFVTGMQYQKNKGSTPTSAQGQFANANSQGGFGSGPGGRGMNGSFGSVTAVTDSSITIKDQRNSSTKTYTIDSSTEVTDNGTAASVGGIVVGDNVMVRTDSSSSTTAISITLNPTMGGPGSASGQTQNDSAATDSNSI